MRTYDIEIDGQVISLRLTNAKLEEYCNKCGLRDAPPSVSVLQACNSLAAKIDLFTAALNYSGAPVGQTKRGAELLDNMADAGMDAEQINAVVAELAIFFGLIPADQADAVRHAITTSGRQVVDKLIAILNNSNGEDSEERPQ